MVFNVACDQHDQVETSVDLSRNEESSLPADSILDFYTESIRNYYISMDTNAYKVELEISGKRAFEDDSLLILSFEEILKFGSWHTTNSSLCFRKSGDALIPIFPSSSEKLSESDYYERDLNYPNRIEGVFYQQIDLTGDGKREFIFDVYGAIRTTFEDKFTFYQLHFENNSVESMQFSICSKGVQGECDQTFGELRTFQIRERVEQNPIIEIAEISSTCEDNTFKIVKTDTSYYVWQNTNKNFVKTRVE